jgi:hypothetical protein
MMGRTVKDARVAGWIYLLLVLVAPFRLEILPAKLFVPGNAAATAAGIARHDALFRLGILSDLLAAVLSLILALALYRLFEPVDRRLAVLVPVFGGLMVTPIYFVNTLNDVAAMLLANGAGPLSAIEAPLRNALTALSLQLHHYGVVVNEVFWGLWLFPFGLLVIRCGFIPRFLGYWLLLNGAAYLVLSFTGIMFPRYEDTVSLAALPFQLGEVAIMLWLLIVGARGPRAALHST